MEFRKENLEKKKNNNEKKEDDEKIVKLENEKNLIEKENIILK